jgi:hypothetical protein
MRRCDACEFWVLGGERSAEDEMKKHADDRSGYCRRNAPFPHDYGTAYELLKHLTHLSWKACTEEERETDFKDWEEACLRTRAWPMTEGSDWCGEFSKKQAEEEER